MNIDIEIYVTNLKNFFKNNPIVKEELFGSYPFLEEEDFYTGVKTIATKNFEKDGEPTLSKSQLLDALELAITKNMSEEFIKLAEDGYLEETDKVNEEGEKIFKITPESMLKMSIENPPRQNTKFGPLYLN
tara:strand:+ start:3937 stop:4329 length:393 start_codon:yes stop_codon:yes gene_type:complete